MEQQHRVARAGGGRRRRGEQPLAERDERRTGAERREPRSARRTDQQASLGIHRQPAGHRQERPVPEALGLALEQVRARPIAQAVGTGRPGNGVRLDALPQPARFVEGQEHRPRAAAPQHPERVFAREQQAARRPDGLEVVEGPLSEWCELPVPGAKDTHRFPRQEGEALSRQDGHRQDRALDP